VRAGQSYLEVGDQHCKVASIQPIDYARISAATGAHHAARKGAMAKSGS
jgi:hypothetical protein